MQIISHTDANHTDTATFPTKHKHIYKKCWRKKKWIMCQKKPIAKLHPIRGQRASRTITRKHQNSNKQYSAYICVFFLGWSHSVCNTACYKTMLLFFHQDAVFERNLFHNWYKQLSLKKLDVNKGITIRFTTYCFVELKELDVMLFHGPLPL